MNAPIAMNETLDHLPLTSIRVSPLTVQGLRRQRFSAEHLLELAASIGTLGVQQPIVVRPVKADGTVKYEIVCGERRWIAAARAGLGHIPAIVRDLTDEAVLEIQLVENLQREGLHPLEEGQGYRELMDMKRIDAEAVGALVGKSRSYVYSRMKLLDLIPTARDALQAGEFGSETALLLARITGDKLQQQALKYIRNLGSGASYQRLKQALREQFMTPLAGVPWALDDVALDNGNKIREYLPACTTCPQRSVNDGELLAALGGSTDVCTNRPCYDAKIHCVARRVRADAQAAGLTVLTGADAKAVLPSNYGGPVKNGLVDLNAPCEDLDFPEPEPKQGKDESDEDAEKRFDAWYDRQRAWTAPTYRELLGNDAPSDGITLAQAPDGRIHTLAPAPAVAKALKTKGIAIDAYRYRIDKARDTDSAAGASPERQAEAAAERARDEEKEKVETEYRERLLKAIWDKWKGPFKRPDLERIAVLVNDCAETTALDKLLPKHWDIDKAKDAELERYIACGLLADEVDNLYHKAGHLLDTAQRLKIDAKKIRTEVVRDLKPTAAPAVASTADKPAVKKKAAKK